jgi:hypothetical protein
MFPTSINYVGIKNQPRLAGKHDKINELKINFKTRNEVRELFSTMPITG